MNKLLVTSAVVLALSTGAAQAGASVATAGPRPAFMVGIAVEFGDTVENTDVGITAKVLSTNKPNQVVLGAGVAYFPFADDKFGLDLDIGYHFDNFSALAGYDFLRQKPQASAGWVYTGCPPGEMLASDGLCYSFAVPSDRRLKRDIRLLATLADGMKIYAFKYLWSDTIHVGVMAQDLLQDPRWQHAVTVGNNGFYAVDYDRLNLRMVTLDDWQRDGVKAIVTGTRRPELLVADAA